MNNEYKIDPVKITEIASRFNIKKESNDFYANYDVAVENHKDWQHILDSFFAMQTNSL
jgi:hypothetical protein